MESYLKADELTLQAAAAGQPAVNGHAAAIRCKLNNLTLICTNTRGIIILSAGEGKGLRGGGSFDFLMPISSNLLI